MSDDLDLRGIDHRHEPNPQFRAALQRRLAAIVAGTDPGSVTEARDSATIDLDSASATFAPKQNRGRVAAAILAAVAAAIAIVLVLETRDDKVTPNDQPSPTAIVPPAATVPPTAPARAIPNNASGEIEPGTYFVDEIDGSPAPRMIATVGSGWINYASSGGWAIINHGIGTMGFSRPDRVFADACLRSGGFHPGPVTTVDGLIAALSEQGGWADVGTPSEISIDGYAGKAFQRTAPTEFPNCEQFGGATRLSDGGAHPSFSSWEGGDAISVYEPGETETLWVLNIDGTVVLINAGVWPGPSWADRADVAAAVLASLRIDRSSSPEAVVSVPTILAPAILPVGGREVSVGPLAPDLGRFADEDTLIDALVASGPLDNQLTRDPALRPGVSICADIVRFHKPTVGTLVHEATALLHGQRGVVLVFMRPRGTKEVHMYATGRPDPQTGACPLLMQAPL